MDSDAMEGMVLLDVTTGSDELDRDMLERLGHVVKVCHQWSATRAFDPA